MSTEILEYLDVVAQILAAKKRENLTKPYKVKDHQRRPDPGGDWRYWLFLGGRGAGKTRTGVEFVMDHLRALGPRARVGIMAPTHEDIVQTCLEGDSGLYANYFHEFKSYHKTNRTLRHRDGGFVRGIGSEQEGRWRGGNWTLIWVDELAQCHQPSVDQANLALRLDFSDIDTSEYNVPNRPIMLGTTTPLPIPRIIEWTDESFTACVVTTGSTFDNAENLDEQTMQAYVDMYGNTTLGRQELYAEILDAIKGARWTQKMLDETRLPELPPVIAKSVHTEMVVAIDPAASADADNDKSAITVVLKGYPYEQVATRGLGLAHYYILDSWAGHATPYTWSKEALKRYLEFHADVIVGEKNNGGDMVQYTIESTIAAMKAAKEWPRGDLIPRIKLVHASRGKKARTDPVIALYEQSRVHHVGVHRVLETEMTRYPVAVEFMDPIDSLTWGVSSLADLQQVEWAAH